jgi:hypothetical protein
MFLRMTVNEYFVPVSEHKCDACGEIFTLCPPGDDNKKYSICNHKDCSSFDPNSLTSQLNGWSENEIDHTNLARKPTEKLN